MIPLETTKESTNRRLGQSALVSPYCLHTMSSAPFTLRWGIVATGWISQAFTSVRWVPRLLGVRTPRLISVGLPGPDHRPIQVSCHCIIIVSRTDKRPRRRNASDLKHVVTAVGSRSVASAQKFIDTILSSSDSNSAKPYGTYEEIYAAPDVDVVYIGTPHTMHYENTKAALLAGKHVLCEKVSKSTGCRRLLDAYPSRGF